MFKQFFGIGSAGGILLEALPQEVIKEGRDRFRNGRFGVLHDTEHNCSRDVSASESHYSLKFSLTRHAVSDIGIWRSSSEQLDHGTSQGPDV